MNSCPVKRRALIEDVSDETTAPQIWMALARLRARIVRRPGRWRRNMKRRLTPTDPVRHKQRLAG